MTDARYLNRPILWGKIPEIYNDQTVVVTGGAGTIGSAIVRALGEKSVVIPLDQDEYGLFTQFGEQKIIHVADVRELSQLRRAFIKFEPHLVFHCAAYKHVPILEAQVDQAISNNIMGTMNIVQCCQEFDAKLVNVSTDKAVSPKSVMGRTKRLAEDIVRHANFSNVRFGNVLNSRGSLLETWREQVAQGLPITLTDQRCTRYFMTVEEAAYLLIQAGALTRGTYVLEMGSPVKISDLAAKFLEHEYPNGKVELVGLRRGEKFVEQLHEEYEVLNKTAINGIYEIKEQN